MISPFAKRSLSVLLSSQLALSPVMSAPNPDIDDAVKRITPQRAIPYHFNALGRDTAFKEYFLSPLGHECAFKAFNTTRQNAVALIEEKINAGSMETIRLLDKAIETDVLNQEIRNLFHDGMGAAEKRQRYLTHYKTTTTMVECHQNEGADATLNTVSLLDVLSYVYRLDLRVYISQENASYSLQLFHKRSLQESKGVVRLLLKNSHYNLLLRDTDPHMLHVKASAKEETYLHEYRAKLTQDAQETQRALVQLGHDENSMEDVELSCDTPTPSSPTLLSSNTRRAPSVSEETVVQPRAVRSTQASFPHRSIVDFLNRKTNRLPGKTYDGSRTSIWQSAKDLSEKTPSTRLQKTTNLINASLYQSALVLDHKFVPTPQTKQATLNEIKKTLQTALQHARQNQQQLGRHYNAALHHMAVYLGRCFAILGDHDLAWQTLSSTLSDGYTRSATLEMARLVLEEGYKPQDMVGALTPETYALSLLDKTHTPRANTTLRKSKAGGTREQMTFVHTPYLNSKEGRAFAKTLKAIAKERQGRARRSVSHDENRSRLSTVLSSRSQAPTQSSQGARASVLFPSPPASRASSVTVRDKRSYEAFLADNGGIVTERLEPRPKRMMTSRDESDEEDTSCSSEIDDRLTISHVSEDEEMLDASHAAAFADEAFTDPDEDEEIASALAFTATPVSHFTIQDVEELLLRAGIAGAHGDNQQAQDFCLEALEKLKTLNAPHLQAKVFFLLGNNQFEGLIDNQHRARIDCYREGLRLATKIRDPKLMAQALIGLGNAQFEGDIAGQRYTGQDCYREGLDLARNAGDQKLMAQALIGLGNARFEGRIAGQRYTEQDCYREGLDLARNAGDPKLMAQALIGLGNAQFEGDIAGQPHTGQDCYREGLDLARNAGDQKLMAQALIGLGNARFEGRIAGQPHTRNDCYREGLDLARNAGDPKLMAQALIGLGNAQFEGDIAGQPHTEQDCYREGLRLATEIHDPKLMAQALIRLGNAQFEGDIDGQPHTRIDCYREGLDLARKARDHKLMAQALIGLGNAQFEGRIAGQRYTGQDCYREGLDLARNAGDPKLMAQALIGLGNAQFEGEIDGQPHTRNDCYREGLDLARNAGDQKLMAQALIGLGNAQFEGDIAGQPHTGQDCYREGLDLARNAGDPKLMAQAYVGLGNAQFEGDIAGQPHTEQDCYREGLDLARNAGDQKLMAQAYVGLGNAQFEGEIDGQPHTRIDCYREGLDLARNAGDQKLMAQAYVGLGNAQFEGDIAGQPHTRIDCYREGLDLARKARDHKLMAQAHLGLGNAYCAQRNNAEGLKHFEQARTMAQRLGNQLLIRKAEEGIIRAKRFLSQNGHHRSARPPHKH